MIEKEFFFPRKTKIAIFLPFIDLVIIYLFLISITKLYDNSWNEQYAVSGTISCFVYLFIGNYIGLYDKYLKPPTNKYQLKIFFCWSLAFILTLTLSFLRKNTAEHSRVILTVWWGVSFVGIVIAHYVWHVLIKILQKKGRYKVNIAIAGWNEIAQSVTDKIINDKENALVLKGIYKNEKDIDGKNNKDETVQNFGCKLGGMKEILADAKNGVFDILFITLPLTEEEVIRNIIKELRDTTVSIYVVPDLFVFDLMHGEMMSFYNTPIIEIFESPFYGVNSFIKRIEDIFIAVMLAPLLLPLMAAVAVIVKLTSKGPVIFKQQRYGLDGSIISIYKFRSMKVCEDGDNIMQARENDERLTSVGHFLRRSSLDELPQFFNVITGQLSVVGPRPHAVAHNEMYREIIDGYMMRHKVKPGITGWAQIHGYRGETKEVEQMRKRVEFDIKYIRGWSLGLDFQIVLKTVWVIITGKNAY